MLDMQARQRCVCVYMCMHAFPLSVPHLLQLYRDHGEGSEHALCGAGDGDDPLGTRTL